MTGWERNDKTKLSPKMVNLSSSMDPVRWVWLGVKGQDHSTGQRLLAFINNYVRYFVITGTVVPSHSQTGGIVCGPEPEAHALASVAFS